MFDVKNIYILESPSQVENAIVANEYFSEKSLFIIRDNGDNESVFLMEKMVKSYGKAAYRKFLIKSTGINKFFGLIWLFIWLVSRKRVRRIIYGDPRSAIRKIIGKGKSSLVGCVDDGAYTLVAFRDIEKGKLKDLDFWVTRFSSIASDKINVIYIPRSCIAVKVKAGEAWFIGMPVVEKNIIAKELYISIMRHARNRLLDMGYNNVFYVPHRSETLEIYSEVFPSDQVYAFGKPIEQYLYELKEGPEIIVSLYSTALFNIADMFTGISVKYIYLDEIGVSAIFRSNVELIYSFLSRHSVIKELK